MLEALHLPIDIEYEEVKAELLQKCWITAKSAGEHLFRPDADAFLELDPAQIVDSLYRWVNRIIRDAQTKAQWILNLIKEAYRNWCCPDTRKFWDSHNKEVVPLNEMQNQIDTNYESSGHPGSRMLHFNGTREQARKLGFISSGYSNGKKFYQDVCFKCQKPGYHASRCPNSQVEGGSEEQRQWEESSSSYSKFGNSGNRWRNRQVIYYIWLQQTWALQTRLPRTQVFIACGEDRGCSEQNYGKVNKSFGSGLGYSGTTFYSRI